MQTPFIPFIAQSVKTKKWKAYIQGYADINRHDKRFVSVGGQPHFGFETPDEAKSVLASTFNDRSSLHEYAKNAGNGTHFSSYFENGTSSFFSPESVKLPWQRKLHSLIGEEKNKKNKDKSKEVNHRQYANCYLSEAAGLSTKEATEVRKAIVIALDMTEESFNEMLSHQYAIDNLLDKPVNSMSDQEIDRQISWIDKAKEALSHEINRRQKK